MLIIIHQKKIICGLAPETRREGDSWRAHVCIER
jgi:hypothetical protein